MQIGIIGAGQIGGTLTRRLRALGHEVHVANSRDSSTLTSLVTETGAVAVEAKDAPRGADLVIVTIPERNVPTLPKGLFAGVPARRRGYRQLLSVPAPCPDCRNRVVNAGKPLGRTEIGTARYQSV